MVGLPQLAKWLPLRKVLFVRWLQPLKKTTSPVKSPDQKKSKTGHNNGNESEVVPSNLESALEAAVPDDPPKSSDGTPEASRLHLQYK